MNLGDLLMWTRSIIVLALLALPIQPANAQGFLDTLFGTDAPSFSRPTGGYVRSQATAGFSPYMPSPSPFGEFFSPSQDDSPQPHERSITYRTVCVRMCDGFYFPISYATGSANFAHDAETCAASCGGEARLFFYPAGGSVEGMLDLTGRAYASYPMAFRYRRTLVQGCQCRPPPWTEAARERHRSYAMAQAPETSETTSPTRSGPSTTRQIAIGAEEVGVAADKDLHAVPRPDPVYRQAGQWNWTQDAGTAGQARSLYRWPGGR